MSKEVPCAFCGANVVGQRFVVCDSCEVPMHHDCWAASSTCPAFACGSAVAIDPALVIYRKTQTAVITVEPAQLTTPARIQKLERYIDAANLAMRPFNRLLAVSMTAGMLLAVVGVKFAFPALIMIGILLIAGGAMAAGIGAADPARRLQAAQNERDRLQLEID